MKRIERMWTETLPTIGQRVSVICGPGELKGDRMGTVSCEVTSKWGQHVEVTMDDGTKETCHGLTERGIGWYLSPDELPACIQYGKS